MITLNEACEKAYSRREEFEAVFELGVDVAYLANDCGGD